MRKVEMSCISSSWIGHRITSKPEKKMVHGVKDPQKKTQLLCCKHKLTNE
jgi:hypothetical protein